MPDANVFPTRGQLVIVRAPWVKQGVTRLGPARDGQPWVYDYTIPRPATGLVVLGGCAERDNWCVFPLGLRPMSIPADTPRRPPEQGSEAEARHGA